MRLLVPATLIGLVAFGVATHKHHHRPRMPLPTEIAPNQEEEEQRHEARREWVRQKKRAPPGYDVDATERANGLRQMARRRALPPPAPGAGTWVERGSSNQAGRTHIAREVDGALYVGSNFGGVWRGTSEATDWTPLGDNLYGGVHWLEIVGDTLIAASDGGLVHRSVDGGTNWEEVAGLGSPWGTRRLLHTSDGTDRLFLITADDSGYQLFRSDDAGATWVEKRDLGSFAGDAWVDRTGAAALYVATADGVMVSTDGAESFSLLSPLPIAATRAELVGCEAGAPRLWMMLDATTLVRSDDGGLTWQDLGAQSDYWGELNASIVDPDRFAFGGMEFHITDDGGESWRKINTWDQYYGDPANLLHADVMGIDVAPEDGDEVWYVNTDGGTYRSRDGLASVQNLALSGLRISQYYSTLTSSANPDHIAAGAQDQGYQITNRTPQDGDEVQEFEQWISGDYGQLTSSDGSHEYVYSVYPGFILVQVGEDDPVMGWGDFPADSYVPWLPPVVADPDDPKVFYFPATHLYKYTYVKKDGYAYGEQYISDSFSSDGYEYLSVMRFAPTDSDRVYMATSYGRFFYSKDHGLTWTQSYNMVPDENWYYGQAITVSPTNPDIVTVGGSGYGTPAVYRTEDGGQTFKPWGQGLPDTLVYSLCEAPDGSGRVLAGTQTSAYVRGPEDSTWTDITDGTAPITTYWSCEALTAENTVRFGTYGRGIWDYRLTEQTGCLPGVDADGDGADCLSDCDDTNAAVFPGAAEVCDGADVNCDPTDLDEGDADGDGSIACLDCDDRNAAAFPGADELCGNSVDEDCDGEAAACAEEQPKEEPGGCGCAGSPGAGIFGLLAILGLRRRA